MIALGNTSNFLPVTANFAPPSMKLVAVGDINGDGRVDLVGHQWGADQEDATPLRVALGRPDGGFDTDVDVFSGLDVLFMDARVLVGDFTGDGVTDLAVYDAGWYDWSVRTTIGGTPILFVGSASGQFAATTAFSDAIGPYVQSGSTQSAGVQIDLTMGVKDVDAGDIDGDGDLDLWVESTGSRNITSHFMINDGTGRFTIDLNQRIQQDTFFGPGAQDYWRYGNAALLDVSGDGRLDVVLGQIRDNHETHLSQSSQVLVNNGNGFFPASGAIKLPLPDFYHGYTSAEAMATWDVNRDGRNDLVLVHTRNDDVSGPDVEPAWTGVYLQVLIQRADGQFTDETAQRIGSQAAWSGTSGEAGNFPQSLAPFDVNADGILDLVFGYDWGRPSSAPMFFLGRADGTFNPGSSDWLTGGDPWFGVGAQPADLNGDSYLDAIHFAIDVGPDGRFSQVPSDDFAVIVAQHGLLPLGGRPSSATGRAFDLAGNAGDVAKVLGAVFGPDAVRDPVLVGVGLQQADAGMNLEQLMSLAIHYRLGGSPVSNAVVGLLYTNVVGHAPDASEQAYYAGLIDSGVHSAASLGVMAAETALNLANIDYPSLQVSGLAWA